MSIRLKRIIIMIIVFVLLGAAAEVASRLVFHRSLAASIAAAGIRVANTGETASPQNADKAMRDRSKVQDEPFVLGERFKRNGKIIEEAGHQIIIFGEKETSNDTVLYLHGGAYINEITDFHLDYLQRMASNTGAYVVAPLYPLAPNHTYEETYEFLDAIYPDLRTEDRNLTIMGDSAGGGLAIAYTEYLVANGKELPNAIVAFSPWVDISMTAEDHEPYEDADPMIEVPGTIEMGKAWAGDTDTKDYRLSPLFGSAEGLPRTDMYVGTREILYPDVNAMYEKMKKAGVDVELHVGEGMTHVYPIYPFVPESVAAANEVYELVKSDGKR